MPITPVQLGAHTLQSPYALAPMAGLTDVPMRTLAWRFGAGYMVSEMVSSKAELWETGKSRQRRVPVPGVHPVAVQIAGTDPRIMADSARRHVDDGVEVIDINLGCPAKKVCRKFAGSALLADLVTVGHIVEAVANAVDVPVTVKTRTGLQPGDGLAAEVARCVAAAGAQMLVMHARSRACRFAGAVDYAAVAMAVAAVDIPVLVNGDVGSPAQARQALTQTGARGVMIGRAAFGRPWIFQELTTGRAPDLATRWDTLLEHLALVHDFYGEHMGVRIARKHIAAYLQHLNVLLGDFQRLDSPHQQRQWLHAARDQQLQQQTRAA